MLKKYIKHPFLLFIHIGITVLIAEDLVFVTQYQPVSFNPYKAEDIYSWQVIKSSYETLVYYDYKTKTIKPLLAKKWETKDNGKTFVFYLRKNVKFHNGKFLTSRDILFSFETLKMQNPYVFKLLFNNLKIIIENDYKILFKLEKEFSPFLKNLSSVFASIVSSYSRNKLYIGSGPFKIKRTHSPNLIFLKRFEHYWGEKPFFKRIIFKIIKEPKRRVEILKNGNADISIIEYHDEFVELLNTKNIKLKIKPLKGGFFLFLNTRKYPFSKRVFRNYFYNAIKRGSLVKKVFSGLAVPKYDFLPDSSSIHLLKESKPSNLPVFEKKIIGIIKKEDEGGIKFLSLLKLFFKNKSIRIEINSLDFPTIVNKLGEFDSDFLFLGWSGYSCDYDSFFSPLFDEKSPLYQYSGFDNKKIRELLILARSTNKIERNRIYSRINAILLKETPFIPLYQKRNAIAYKKELKNVFLTIDGKIHFERIRK